MGGSADLPSVACPPQSGSGTGSVADRGRSTFRVRVRAAETMVGPIDSATYTYVTSGVVNESVHDRGSERPPPGTLSNAAILTTRTSGPTTGTWNPWFVRRPRTGSDPLPTPNPAFERDLPIADQDGRRIKHAAVQCR